MPWHFIIFQTPCLLACLHDLVICNEYGVHITHDFILLVGILRSTHTTCMHAKHCHPSINPQSPPDPDPDYQCLMNMCSCSIPIWYAWCMHYYPVLLPRMYSVRSIWGMCKRNKTSLALPLHEGFHHETLTLTTALILTCMSWIFTNRHNNERLSRRLWWKDDLWYHIASKHVLTSYYGIVALIL